MNPDLTKILADASDIVLTDRSRYDLFFSALEEVCSDLHLKIFGNSAANIVLGGGVDRCAYFYEIFIGGGFNNAKDITARIYDRVKNNTMALYTDIKNAEFTITMDGRRLVKLYSRSHHHGVNPLDLLSTILHKGLFTDKELEITPEELVIIGYCKILHNPARYCEWKESEEKVGKLWERIDTVIESRVTGGSVAHFSLRLPSDAIIVGEEALRILGLIDSTKKHMQIISSANIEDIAEIVSKSVKRPTKWVNHHISLPGDNFLTKQTVYAIIGDGRQRPILDVYNSTSYEIVETVRSGKEVVGGYWTILRFLFLDLWMLRLIKSIGGIDTSRADVLLVHTVHLIRKVLQSRSEFDNPEYAGVNIAEKALRKKISTGILPPWLPGA